ncbi:MAG: UDP-N-acetylglucosamine 1-carboxyvinyltransferase, partial [bacterium]
HKTSSETVISRSVRYNLMENDVSIHSENDSWIKLNSPPDGITSADITTAVYPGFPTDLQPLWSALMCRARGNSVITDTIYPERFTHVPELQRLGGDLRQELNSVYIRGVPQLRAAPLMCSDIRGGAALVVAALAAEGTSRILRVYHIDRGYERMEEKLRGLGAKLWREKNN